MSATIRHIDEALDRLLRLQDQLLQAPDAPQRAAALAELFVLEARAWSQLFEATQTRLVWRAALAAEARARAHANRWQRRAGTERLDRAPGREAAEIGVGV